MSVKSYLIAKSVEQSIELLEKNLGEARFIAGGTDLMLWIKEKKVDPKILVDVTEISELQTLDISDDKLTIGAAVTHARVAAHAQIRKTLPVLSDACESVGSPQIRNIATLSGNIVSAQPAADSAIALIALGANAEIISSSGSRLEAIEDLYLGVGKSKIDSSRELITRIIVTYPTTKYGTSFERIAPRNALALPVINVATYINIEDEKIRNARICIGPVSTRPFRPVKAESSLTGVEVENIKALTQAAQIASEEVNPRDSLLRGSGNYRRVLVRDLVEKALNKAVEQAKGGLEHGSI